MNYNQTFFFFKWQLLIVQMKKRGSNDESSPKNIWQQMELAKKLSIDGANLPIQTLNLLG
jgi:hypothetical protein